jgi:hypothetical protein
MSFFIRSSEWSQCTRCHGFHFFLADLSNTPVAYAVFWVSLRFEGTLYQPSFHKSTYNDHYLSHLAMKDFALQSTLNTHHIIGHWMFFVCQYHNSAVSPRHHVPTDTTQLTQISPCEAISECEFAEAHSALTNERPGRINRTILPLTKNKLG